MFYICYIRLVTRTCAVVEDIIHGVGVFLTSPVSENHSEAVKKSWRILKEVPYDALMVAAISFRYIFWDLILAFGEPKLLIVEGVEYAEVYREHLEKNTVGTKEYYEDLASVQGRAYSGLLKWQRTKEGTIKGKNDHYSMWVRKNLNKIRN